MDEIQALKNALQRERAARKQAESILEQKSLELYTINQELEAEVQIRIKDIELLSRFPLENSSPVLRINQQLEITFFNKPAEKIVSFVNEHEVLKKNIFENILAVFSTNEILDKEFYIDEKYYELHFVPIENHNYVNIYGADITSRKETEFSLQESRKQYKQLIESASDIIYRSSFKGDFLYVNPVGSRLSGYSQEELLKMNFTDLIQKKYVKEVISFYQNQFKERIPSTYYEYPIVNKFGDIKWLGQYVQIIFSGKSDYIDEFVAVARDITERKKAEYDLIEARKKAEDSAKVKEQFLANMSHEIRTPIHVILGMANLLQEKLDLDKEQTRYIQAILKSGENLSIIINDILDFSKIEAGKLELEHIHFDLKESINSVASLFKIKAEEKDLLLETVIDKKLHQYYHSDPHRLNQILLNLVNNALKFTEFGKIKISVSLGKEDEKREHVLFSVEDTGIGISQENLSKIFKDFSQVDKSDTRKYGGTGLGLSISKKLVELLGGEIGVQSSEGKGTCFYFLLPLEKVDQLSILKEEKEETPYFDNIHILLVEDNPYNQLLVETIFKDMGIKTTIANHGKEAITFLEKESYDLILMDIQMPIMNGIEATAYIRKELKSEVPIIALTANAIKGDQDKYIKQGMNAYLSKPFTFPEIYQLLKEFLPNYQNIPFVIQEKTKSKTPDILYYDLSYLESMGIEDPTFISQMITVFLLDVPKTLMLMDEKYQLQECEEVGKLAHRLLSSSRTFKMNQIVSHLEILEEAGFNEKWEVIQKEYKKIVPLFEIVLKQLKEIQ